MRRVLLTGLTVAVLVACAGDSGRELAESTGDDAVSTATEAPDTAVTPPAASPASEPAATSVLDDPPPADPSDARLASQVRSITVGGMGAEYATPVRSVVNLAVSVRRPTVEEASEVASAAASAVIAAIEARGVPASDIQTSEFMIFPVSDPYNYQLITAYEVTLGYNVAFSDIDDVGSVLAEAIVAGGNSVRANGVRFEPDPAALMGAARAKAWEDVRARAAATAELAGEPLGAVLDVHEKVLITSPQGMVQGGEGDSASFDIPVAPGSAGVIVLLTVTYEIGT